VFIVPDLVGQRSQTPSFRVAGNTPETGTWTRCRQTVKASLGGKVTQETSLSFCNRVLRLTLATWMDNLTANQEHIPSYLCSSRAGYAQRSILGGDLLQVVDHEDLDGDFPGLESEPQLLP
jgi:hypothetical protein